MQAYRQIQIYSLRIIRNSKRKGAKDKIIANKKQIINKRNQRQPVNHLNKISNNLINQNYKIIKSLNKL